MNPLAFWVFLSGVLAKKDGDIFCAFLFFFFFLHLINLFLAVLVLCCCTGFSLVASSGGYSSFRAQASCCGGSLVGKRGL